MADPYATRTPDLSGRPSGPPPWGRGIVERGGGLLGAGGAVPGGAEFLVVPCRGIGTLAPFVRPRPALAVLLWLEHAAEPLDAGPANRLLRELTESATPAYAIKQGCVGGPADRPGCFAIEPALIESVLDAAVAGTVAWEADPDFGYEVPGEVPGLGPDSGRALLPRLLYADHDRVYEHASLVAAKKRERHELAARVEGLDETVVAAADWPPQQAEGDWRSR